MKFGYARVSTKEQNEARQIEALMEWGVNEKEILIDKASGFEKKRPELDTLRMKIRAGDEVVIVSMDRLARSLVDLNAIVQEITEKEASVSFIKEGQTFKPASQGRDPMATLMLGVLGSVAHFELDIIKQRQAEGISAAKARGVYTGRKETIDRGKVKALLAVGLSRTQIAKEIGASRSSVVRISNKLEEDERA